ncbi:pre-mRNA-splicing factor CWC22-like [Sigmodon hispidus]
MFAVRKDGFKDHPVVLEGLDLVEEDDQFTHMLPLEDDYNPEDVLNVFKMDPSFMEKEEKYKAIKKEILDEGDSDSNRDQEAGSSEDEEEEDEEEEGEEEDGGQKSSLDFEECAHKLLKMEFAESQTKELCNMILDCYAQQRTYEKFFGLLAGRFCMLKKEYMESFESIFKEQYDTIYRLETNKLRNVAKMFAHLLYTDLLPRSVLECIMLSEETTTSSSRIFVKIFFQELCEYMGLPKLNARSQSSTSVKDRRKKRREKAKSEEADKAARGQQTRNRRQEGGREDQGHQEGRTEQARSERHRAQHSRDDDWRDPLSRFMVDRGLPSSENTYGRVGNGQDQDGNRGLEDKHGESKKKRPERRDSFSENDKQRTRNQNSENVRRKDRFKSRERSRKHSGHKSDDDRYQNGSERRWEKCSRYSDHSRELKTSKDRRREKTPTRQK